MDPDALALAFVAGGLAAVVFLALPAAWLALRRGRHGTADRQRLARLEDLVASLVADQSQVEELAVRLDFTEQLLAERHAPAEPATAPVGRPRVGKLWRPPPYDA